MSAISRVGFRLMAMTGTLAVIGVLIQIANAVQIPGRPAYTPPPAFNTWQRSEGAPPRMDSLRGNPSAHYFIYTNADQPPAHVSIARADTLDAYRPPYLYLLDEDGRILGGNQESFASRAYQETPLRTLYVGEGRGDTIAILHWTQAPGEDPVLDPTDAPGRMFGSMLTKKPFYICDVWVPLRNDANFALVHGSLTFLADKIDAQIKALPRN